MYRILTLLTAVLLTISSLPAAAEHSGSPTAVLGGTSWRSPDGAAFHFTGDADLFFSYDPSQPMYHLVGPGLYMTSPATEIGAPYLVLDSARRCTFTLEGAALMVDDLDDDTAPAAFTYINYPAALAGTRWLDEHGTIFEFNADSSEFTCGCYGISFRRMTYSLGAYYELTIGDNAERWFDPAAPFALIPAGDTLYAYATRDGKHCLAGTYIRITD